MKDIPLLACASMAVALLDGLKTNTRRLRFLGKPGDTIWFRETWATPHDCDHLKPREIPQGTPIHFRATWEGPSGLMWRPSIFMPRWASRIQRQVVAVRQERLQDITEEDALAEGVRRTQVPTFFDGPGSSWVYEADGEQFGSARRAFAYLWDGLNGVRASWESNPLVWRIEFRRQEA